MQNKVSIALYASEEMVRIRLAIKASDQIQADALVEQTKALIEERLHDYQFK